MNRFLEKYFCAYNTGACVKQIWKALTSSSSPFNVNQVSSPHVSLSVNLIKHDAAYGCLFHDMQLPLFAAAMRPNLRFVSAVILLVCKIYAYLILYYMIMVLPGIKKTAWHYQERCKTDPKNMIKTDTF